MTKIAKVVRNLELLYDTPSHFNDEIEYDRNAYILGDWIEAKETVIIV